MVNAPGKQKFSWVKDSLWAKLPGRIGVTDKTYCRWPTEYGGMRIDEVKRLKRLVADLSLDITILEGGK